MVWATSEQEECERALTSLDLHVRAALDHAATRIRAYHAAQADTPEVEAEMAAIKRRIESWKEGGDEDALDGAIGHYNSLADDYGLPRYGYDKPHYASAPEGVYNDDGEPLGFDYPSDPGEDDSNDEDEWYDDYAHEAKVERHAISDEFDLRPLHSRVATAFLKKG